MNLFVVVPVVLALVGLRLLRAGLLAWLLAWWIALYVSFRWGFATPIPQSVIQMYMAIASLALFAYATSSPERWREVSEPILRFVTGPRKGLLALAIAAIPALVAWNIHASANTPVAPPFFPRTVHPAPPPAIDVHDESIDLVNDENPLRVLKETDPAAFQRHVENGRALYYRHCVFCHGDALGGDGMYAHGLNPVPANFLDQGLLPNFQESFFFWRVAKGGPGLPDEGAPGDSAMPAWERFLSTEEIWEVVLFLYEETGYKPRARETAHGVGGH